jgi:hypothetical protein
MIISTIWNDNEKVGWLAQNCWLWMAIIPFTKCGWILLKSYLLPCHFFIIPNQTIVLCNDEKYENLLDLDLDYLATTPLGLLNLNKWILSMNNEIYATFWCS